MWVVVPLGCPGGRPRAVFVSVCARLLPLRSPSCPLPLTRPPRRSLRYIGNLSWSCTAVSAWRGAWLQRHEIPPLGYLAMHAGRGRLLVVDGSEIFRRAARAAATGPCSPASTRQPPEPRLGPSKRLRDAWRLSLPRRRPNHPPPLPPLPTPQDDLRGLFGQYGEVSDAFIPNGAFPRGRVAAPGGSCKGGWAHSSITLQPSRGRPRPPAAADPPR
jgi:hypothetical protein